MNAKKSPRSQMRHRSREIALQLIYQLDLRPSVSPEEAIAMFLTEEENAEVAAYACDLVRGVAANAAKIAEILRNHIVAWRPERMVAVDKVAISIALYEGLIAASVPVAVAISEAVELAKAFGTEDSGRFVNGVLGRIVRENKPE